MDIKVKILLISLIILAVYLLFFDNSIYQKNGILYLFRNRLDRIWLESDSSLGDGRGYNRIFEIGSNLLWGMGEGGYYRFDTMSGHETHSSYVAIFVSYGIFGFLLWIKTIAGLLFTYNRNKLLSFCLFSGIFLYWITHQGLRNTVFWLLIATYMLRCNYSWDVAPDEQYHRIDY